MSKIKGTVVIDKERCKGCKVCVVTCPTQVLALAQEVNGRGYYFSFMQNPDACTGCTSCAMVCPDSCITVYRQRVDL